jgi:hypothetical protein
MVLDSSTADAFDLLDLTIHEAILVLLRLKA